MKFIIELEDLKDAGQGALVARSRIALPDGTEVPLTDPELHAKLSAHEDEVKASSSIRAGIALLDVLREQTVETDDGTDREDEQEALLEEPGEVAEEAGN